MRGGYVPLDAWAELWAVAPLRFVTATHSGALRLNSRPDRL